ncbi:hypothetical protein EGR_09786 [Echinococcus granulosus]|uniref:Uncharacterized protein n=1 Tax=Echinococcus granulosus TaxID=6210 RepID=W6UPL0_ECHGR|nr:hypothetical protein EGR_09786 [Echinococcus granulosus]EUB55349.1 hypothetical protein EGR_09786 [Echinococcus granulosus]
MHNDAGGLFHRYVRAEVDRAVVNSASLRKAIKHHQRDLQGSAHNVSCASEVSASITRSQPQTALYDKVLIERYPNDPDASAAVQQVTNKGFRYFQELELEYHIGVAYEEGVLDAGACAQV